MDENLNEEEIQNEKASDKKEEKRKNRNAVLLYVIFTIVLSALCSFISVKIALKEEKRQVVVYKQPENDIQNIEVSTEPGISSIVDKIVNSVVEVYTESVSYSTFYGEYVNEGAGSGVIYSSDGYIITNNHVIENATSIKVTLPDGQQFDAELVATDNVSDIAVIKINAENLPTVVLGNSDNLKIGQYCIAVGNPLGTLGGTVTNGIISALSREVTIDGQKMNLLQTNTAINPGNSGGGLFDYNGNLIGIVNAKSGGSNIEGIGFAIPINYAASIAQQLIEKGYVEGRPQLGIRGTEINSIQQAWNYSVNCYGIYVSELTTESAKQSGLQIGDVITLLNNEDVTTFEKLKSVLCDYTAGETVELTVARGKDTVTIKLMLEQKK